MSRLSRTVLSVVALTVIAAGCSDPKEVSKNNFRNVLQKHYDASPECTLATIHEFPLEVQANTGSEKAQLKAMAQVGLLKAVRFQKEIEPLFSWGKHTKQMTDFVRYELTEEGRKFVKHDTSFVGGTELCFGKRHVTEVTSFTEPGDMMGMKVSHVRYTYEIVSLEEWTRNALVQGAFGGIKNVLQKPEGEASATLVLTGDGWKDSAEVH